MLPDCMTAIALLMSILVYIFAITSMTQKSTDITYLATMRFLIPLFPIIAIISAIALITLWQQSHILAGAMFAVFVFSNALHLAPISMAENGVLRCTLCKYVSERFGDYETGSDGYLKAINQIPHQNQQGSSVRILPTSSSFAPMFHFPELTYCHQLTPEMMPEIFLKNDLPKCVYAVTGCADYLIEGNLKTGPGTLATRTIDGCSYRAQSVTPVYYKDWSRPEIPWHIFESMPDRYAQEQGIVTFYRD